MADARRYPRYYAKRGVLAALNIPHEMEERVGELVDLGEGGLAFVYSGTGEPYAGPADVEVFGFEAPELRIGRVRCRVVYENILEESPEGALERRRCGLEFDPSVRAVVGRLRAFVAANADSDEETKYVSLSLR